MHVYRVYKCCYDEGQDQDVLLYVSRAELKTMPANVINANWGEYFQRIHSEMLDSDIEKQTPHAVSYIIRKTGKKGAKKSATFFIHAGERLYQDYEFMRNWPRVQGTYFGNWFDRRKNKSQLDA